MSETAAARRDEAAGPIGVFDSGVGGLSVLREIRALLPHEDLLYVADSAHIPYGEKSTRFVEARSLAITTFLLKHRAKAVVVACNTASSAALATLRAQFSVPIVGMEPAVKPAAQQTRSRRVAVLATSGTLASEKFAQLLARVGGGVAVHVQACPGLVEQVEAGALDGDDTRALVEKYVAPLLHRGVDTLVLGCTHYPFLLPLIRQVAGPAVSVIDPSPAVARELRRRLESERLLAPAVRPGSERFCSSGPTDQTKRVMAQLWGKHVPLAPMTES